MSKISSRELFLAQLARCVQHQWQDIILAPEAPQGQPEMYEAGQVLSEESIGNGAPIVPCEQEMA